MPKFSIILPVRNGGEFVKECVISIMTQEFGDFELLVLDNCSTDGTSEWLKSITDTRIKIFCTDKPLSIEENWGRVLSLDKSEYMTLIGHDDILHSNYLLEMNRLITAYPDATLYQTHFNYIDSQSKIIRDCKPMLILESTDSLLDNCLKRNIDLMGTGFMMRSRDYNELGGIPDYPNLLFADFELWINLTKKGYKATSTENCFSFRVHNSTTSLSADFKMQQAFERFIRFLGNLGNENKRFETIIKRSASEFLEFYCRGFVHRVLRTPWSDRQGVSVKSTIEKFERFARQLDVLDTFRPRTKFSIWLAFQIDKSTLGRSLFLFWKKLFPRPVLR